MTRADPLRQPVRRHSWLRRTFFRTSECVLRMLGGRAWYRWRHLSPRGLRVREEVVRIPEARADLDGLTIAHLSDVHAGPFLKGRDLDHVLATVKARNPDVIVFTGDLVANRHEEAELVRAELGSLSAPLGVFGVFGNHDYRDRREGELAASYAEHGWRFLRNEGVRIAERRMVVTGVEDPEEGRALDIEAARAVLEPGDLELCLCHHPGAAAALAREGCVAVFSGHAHGGQMDVWPLTRFGPPHPGLRVELGPTVLIASRGIGVVGGPLRFRASPEVVFVRLSSDT
tara:strand:+ start:1380 stop:2240 length:861 start_codon:yes stop_codon:yes gene_type:complete